MHILHSLIEFVFDTHKTCVDKTIICSLIISVLKHLVATYPSAGGRRMTRGMRVPRKEYARSRHQRLFEENVGKTGKDVIYELLSERFGSCIYARGRC